MMMNCFCGIIDRRKAFSLISSRDHCQRSSPLRISDMPSRVWTCAEPEFRLSWMKLCSSESFIGNQFHGERFRKMENYTPFGADIFSQKVAAVLSWLKLFFQICFVVWLTDGRRLALFSVGIIVRDPHHREYPTRSSRVWTCAEPEFRRSWMKFGSSESFIGNQFHRERFRKMEIYTPFGTVFSQKVAALLSWLKLFFQIYY